MTNYYQIKNINHFESIKSVLSKALPAELTRKEIDERIDEIVQLMQAHYDGAIKTAKNPNQKGQKFFSDHINQLLNRLDTNPFERRRQIEKLAKFYIGLGRQGQNKWSSFKLEGHYQRTYNALIAQLECHMKLTPELDPHESVSSSSTSRYYGDSRSSSPGEPVDSSDSSDEEREIPAYPRVIILFNSEDKKTKGEVHVALENLYRQHGGSPRCLIAADEAEVLSLAKEMDTPIEKLVLLGHGQIHRAGDKDETTGKILDEAGAAKMRKAAMLHVGPYHEIYNFLPDKIAKLIESIRPQECVLKMCLGGYLSQSAMDIPFDLNASCELLDADPSILNNEGFARYTANWEPSLPSDSLPFDKHSIAGLLWNKLKHLGYLKTHDFKLTASPMLTSPLPASAMKRHGFFFQASAIPLYDNCNGYQPPKNTWRGSERDLDRAETLSLASSATDRDNSDTTFRSIDAGRSS